MLVDRTGRPLNGKLDMESWGEMCTRAPIRWVCDREPVRSRRTAYQLRRRARQGTGKPAIRSAYLRLPAPHFLSIQCLLGICVWRPMSLFIPRQYTWQRGFLDHRPLPQNAETDGVVHLNAWWIRFWALHVPCLCTRACASRSLHTVWVGEHDIHCFAVLTQTRSHKFWIQLATATVSGCH